MIAVSADGQIRFWGTLGAALAGVDRHQEVVCQLGPEELVDRICAVDVRHQRHDSDPTLPWGKQLNMQSSSYLITTNQSRIFRLTITSQGGRQTPAVAPLVRSNGMFSRASPVLFGADEDRQGIASIAVGDKEAWIVSGKTAQKWVFADGAKVSRILLLDVYLVNACHLPENISADIAACAGTGYTRLDWQGSFRRGVELRRH